MFVCDKKENCSGCTACVYLCVPESIEMKSDEEGFLYPWIDKNSCIECGLCRMNCPFHDNFLIQNNFPSPKVFAVKHKADDIRIKSSSGGMFTALSDYILSVGGSVYGAAFNDRFEVCHMRVENPFDRDKFRGSKYVQSNLGMVFADIKNDLANNKKVLFTGTPCQCAGLYVFMGGSNENLIVCDLICHGVPSPLMWKEYLAFLEKRTGSNLIYYCFRDKENGWHRNTVKASYSNGYEDNKSFISQKYLDLYYSHLVLRPSCHNCKFCNFSRPSDITIGDFWNIEKTMPDFDDEKGISLVLINSSKGDELFDIIKPHIITRQSNVEDCSQPSLIQPFPPHPDRDVFWQDYNKNGFYYTFNKYIGVDRKAEMNSRLKDLFVSLRKSPPVRKLARVKKWLISNNSNDHPD